MKPSQGQPGWKRLVNAWRYSMAGLASAYRSEAAFRQELALGFLLLVWVAVRGGSWLQKWALVASVVLVFVVELINTAIEAVVDLASPDKHDLACKAKDIASAAVWLSLVHMLVVAILCACDVL